MNTNIHQTYITNLLVIVILIGGFVGLEIVMCWSHEPCFFLLHGSMELSSFPPCCRNVLLFPRIFRLEWGARKVKMQEKTSIIGLFFLAVWNLLLSVTNSFFFYPCVNALRVGKKHIIPFINFVTKLAQVLN